MSLELKDITYEVGGQTHIHATSLSLVEGQFNTLLGTTLAGKTTLMQLMAGLLQPTTGRIHFAGRDVTGIAVQKRNVSMVYQQFINYPNFSVFENIASPLRVAGVSRAEISRRVGGMAELLKLTPMLDRRPAELSGGQQQRTAMARALVKDADLVLLDEPLANLDFKLREELRDELPRLFADRNCTVVYATTEPSEALLLGGHTAAMHEGRVVQYGPTGKVYRKPDSVLAAKVFSEPPINVFKVAKKAGQFELANGAVWPDASGAGQLPDADYLAGLRPHHVSPVKHEGDDVELEGDVVLTELSGSESVIQFDHGGQSWVSQTHGIHPLETGDRTRFHFRSSRCLYFTLDGRRVAAGEAA